MTPDEVVSVMVGGDDFNRVFEGICAYRLENNVVKKIDPAWWNGFARPRIEAVAASHTAAENNGTITNEAAYVLWQEQSLQALPSGAFIWKDEFEQPYYRKYAWGNIILLDARTEDAHQKSVTLKFDPFIPESAMQRMVMEGFENVMIDNLNTERLKNSAAQALSQTSLPVATSINAPLATGDVSYASDASPWKGQAIRRARAISQLIKHLKSINLKLP